MAAQNVRKCSVDVSRAMNLLNNGYGRLVFTWDSRIWQYWRRLRWDLRPDSERDTQPDDVDAYILTPDEARLLGLKPSDNEPCVLFVLYEVQTESFPIRATVVSDSHLEAQDTANDT